MQIPNLVFAALLAATATTTVVHAADANACIAATQKFTNEVTQCATQTTSANMSKCLCGISTLVDDYNAVVSSCGAVGLPASPFSSVDQFKADCAAQGYPVGGSSGTTTTTTTKSGAASLYAGNTVFAASVVAVAAAAAFL
ncbi:hypothetical protein DFJ73DRAFT_778850 [Zopfochytrium polystomum]|nr:hypothetical protein DFJ73DRAFT_778850 [Zopfochytrium polystomum]